MNKRQVLVIFISGLILGTFLFILLSDQSHAIAASTHVTRIEIDCSYFVFLPIINRVSNLIARLSPFSSDTPPPLISSLPCLDPGPVTGALADPDRNGDLEQPIRPRNGACPNGTHPIHKNGWPNFFEGEDESWTFADTDYTCVPDDTLADAQCTAHGDPVLLGGLAACQCQEGYTGASCNVCAPGYQLDPGSQTCRELIQPPHLTILGIEDSIEAGSLAVFEATDERGFPIRSTWTLSRPQDGDVNMPSIDHQADGCLFEVGGSQTCQVSVTGTQAGYLAPNSLADDAAIRMVQLNINPVNNPQLSLTTQSIVIVGPGGIPINGQGDARMEPILNILSRYMRQRCIGAAMLGVSRYGYPLAVYGLGRKDGRAAASWHDYCGDDMGLPMASPTTQKSPMRMGSANKPITFAVLRWVLKERLKENDTDLDVVMVSSQRAVSAQRLIKEDIKIVVWDVAVDGSLTQLDEDIYQPPPVNGIATRIRNLDLAALPNGLVVLGTHHTALSRLNIWSISSSGELLHLSGLTIGSSLIDLKITPLLNNIIASNRFAAATRDKDGVLSVRVYQVTPQNQITLLDTIQIENARARDLDLTDISESTFSRIIVGNRNGDRRLVLRTFNIAADGKLSQVDQHSSSPAGEGLSMTTLTSNRIVTAIRNDDSRLWLMSWSIAPDGNFQLQQTWIADAVDDLSLTALSSTRVFVAARLASNGNLQVTTYDVAANGSFNLLDEDGGGNLSGVAVHSFSPVRAVVALRNASHNLENIVWGIAANGSLTRLDEITGDKVADSSWTDQDVENLNLVGFDLPKLLLPDRLHAILRGDVQPPVYLPLDDCDDLTAFADPQWKDVKIVNVLGHTTGLPKSSPGTNAQVESLPLIRSLDSLQKFATQELILRDEFGHAVVDTGKALLNYNNVTTFVLPSPNLEEVFILTAGRCLPNALGTRKYSNSSASLSGLIIQHLAGRFAANLGDPASHDGSALDLFFDYELGVQTSGDSGAFYSQLVFGLPGYSFPDPAYRAWSGNTYYPRNYDNKRPHCVWNGLLCSFADWVSGSHGALRWLWNSSQTVPFEFESTGVANGSAGNLSLEPGVQLTFMRNHWVNNDSGGSISIGEKRNNTWNSFRIHNGVDASVKAQTMQMGKTGNPFSLDFELPRKYRRTYIPITAEDVFGAAESAFFIAKASNGQVQTFHSAGQLVDQTNVAFTAGDSFAVGANRIHNGPESFYIARPTTGMVDVFEAASGNKYSYQVDFSAGDGFVVDDIIQSTTVEEMIIGDASSGQVRIYPVPPLVLNGTAIPIATFNLNFSPGDKLAVGDANGNGTNELYIARVATGVIQIYTANGSLWKELVANFSAADGYAVGDVVGINSDRDEIIIGRAQTHVIDVYNYTSGEYQLYTSFNGLYQANGDLAVNDLGYSSHLNEIIVGVPGYGLAVVFKAQKVGEAFQFFLQDFEALNAAYNPGDQLAAGFWRGLHRYRCGFGTHGTRQSDYPDGVDIVLSINTTSDRQCTLDGDQESCGNYFSKIRDRVLLYGVCEIDWSNVFP